MSNVALVLAEFSACWVPRTYWFTPCFFLCVFLCIGFEWKVSYNRKPLMFHRFECREKEHEHLYEPHQITSEWTKVQQKSGLKIAMETFYQAKATGSYKSCKRKGHTPGKHGPELALSGQIQTLQKHLCRSLDVLNIFQHLSTGHFGLWTSFSAPCW